MKTYVVQELRTGVPLDVVGIEVTPTQLNVDPELVARSTVQYVFALCHGTISAAATTLHHTELTSVTRDGLAMFHL